MPYVKPFSSEEDRILNDFKYLVVSIVNKFCKVESWRADLMQAGYLALIQASRSFNSDFKTQFITWAHIQVSWAVKTEINKTYLTGCSPNTRSSRPENYTSISDKFNVKDTRFNPLEELLGLEEAQITQEFMMELKKKLDKKLSKGERYCFIKYYIEGKKPKVIIAHSKSFYKHISKIYDKIAIILGRD